MNEEEEKRGGQPLDLNKFDRKRITTIQPMILAWIKQHDDPYKEYTGRQIIDGLKLVNDGENRKVVRKAFQDLDQKGFGFASKKVSPKRPYWTFRLKKDAEEK